MKKKQRKPIKNSSSSYERGKEKVLFYCMEENRYTLASAVLKRMQIQVERVDTTALPQKLGFLFGMRGFGDGMSQETTDFQQETAIFYSIRNQRLDTVLLALKDAGITLQYKVVATPFNVHWSLARLFNTISKEHAYLVSNV